MPDNTANDVFRFVQIRPPLPPEEPFAKLDDSDLARQVRAAPTVHARVDLANGHLASGGAIRSLADVHLGKEMHAAITSLRGDAKATTADLLKKLDRIAVDEAFTKGARRLSDTLLATFFATAGHPADLDALQDVYRAYDLIKRAARGKPEVVALGVFLRRPILTPYPLEPLAPAPPPAPVPAHAPRAAAGAAPASLGAAITELAALDRSRFLNAPGKGVSFALKAEHGSRLSEATRRVLAARDLDPAAVPVYALVEALDDERRAAPPAADAADAPGRVNKMPLPGPIRPFVRPVGVADLLVVKQQLKRYDPIDIAHIENVLSGEKKSRSHRRLERSEETFTRETETTTEREKELETADRFELNRETSKTIRESLDIGVDLSVSGKYGPSVEFSSNFELDSKRAQEETTKSAATFAHNVVERSLERITERVREQIVRKMILETEETNLHELNNPTPGKHIRGVYQFLEKVYEAQVFNYGVRQLFDFIVPEPASFVWWMQGKLSTLKLPDPPAAFPLVEAAQVSVDNYRLYAARYGALDVEMPPPEYRRVLVGKKHGEDNASEKDQPRSIDRIEVTLPAGYVPSKAIVRFSCFTDEKPVLAVTILDQTKVWRPDDRTDLSDGHRLHTSPQLEFDFTTNPVLAPLLAGDKLGIDTMVWESNSYTVEALLVCARTGDEYLRWKLATYKKIRQAYDDRVREHELTVRTLKAEAESLAAQSAGRTFGRAPSENHRTIMTELKKHCLSILTQQWFDTFDAMNDPPPVRPPTFDLDEAEKEGAFIRFFEHAFEWEQIQWVFYPYFWSRIDTWADRFARQDVDPLFREFLQAGSARVVVPVRPGFELAVTHYVETGKIWNGTGTPPAINSPLYVSIVDEIRDRTAAGKGEIPVGEPWDVKLPTPLVYTRAKDDLPRWQRVAGKDWEWHPVPEP